MLEPVIATVPVRSRARLEYAGPIAPEAAPAPGLMWSLLDTVDLVVATSLQAFFNAIKR